MSRAPSNSPEIVRATVVALLAEAGQPAPSSPEEFRRHVSVRRVRARLGGGDTTALGRQINEIEIELVSAGRARLSVPGIPEHVAALMQGLWAAALDAQTREVIRLQQAASESVEQAEFARDNALARVELLKVELDDLRRDLSARHETIGELRARIAEAERHLASASADCQAATGRLEEVTRQGDQARRDHETQLALVRAEYDGLGRQLHQETDAMRQAIAAEKQALQTGLAKARQAIESQQQLIEELQADRQRLKGALASQRDASPDVR
ncbi:DNA-binding protein [Paraburkholderia phenazinium]|uniref:DNA-binding protein n=1 Tax=Paraburkholderia phenazinium TaxID=60549 RepID=UPI00158E0D93|nr:DNA-binding protein [Paraburkholderia phenazinium]